MQSAKAQLSNADIDLTSSSEEIKPDPTENKSDFADTHAYVFQRLRALDPTARAKVEEAKKALQRKTKAAEAEIYRSIGRELYDGANHKVAYRLWNYNLFLWVTYEGDILPEALAEDAGRAKTYQRFHLALLDLYERHDAALRELIDNLPPARTPTLPDRSHRKTWRAQRRQERIAERQRLTAASPPTIVVSVRDLLAQPLMDNKPKIKTKGKSKNLPSTSEDQRRKTPANTDWRWQSRLAKGR